MAENEEKKTKQGGTVAAVYDWLTSITFALVVVLFLLTFVFRQVTVNGTSMNNTLADGDRLIVENFMYSPQYGDIVVVSHGEHYEDAIIKRVIATGGQVVDIDFSTGEVSVDGVIIDEPYIKGFTKKLGNSTEFPLTVPKNCVFVMGDNRENSLDSRSKEIGIIPENNIVGKAVFRMYPVNAWGGLYDNM